MKKIVTILLLVICVCQATNAKVSSDNDNIKSLEKNLAKLLQKSEMRKDIVIELSYKGFG